MFDAVMLSAMIVSLRHHSQNLMEGHRDARIQSKCLQILLNTMSAAIAYMISNLKQILGDAVPIVKQMVSSLKTGLSE